MALPPSPRYIVTADFNHAGHTYYHKCSCPSYPWSNHLGPDYTHKLTTLLHKLLHLSPYAKHD